MEVRGFFGLTTLPQPGPRRLRGGGGGRLCGVSSISVGVILSLLPKFHHLDAWLILGLHSQETWGSPPQIKTLISWDYRIRSWG